MSDKRTDAIRNVFETVKARGVTMIDFKFMDFPGQWQHFSVPVTQLDEGSFEEGFGFDGSSLRGFKSIHESDMVIIPDPDTAMVDPFIKEPTLSLICDIYEPLTHEKYERCPRNIAQKAEQYLISTGIADTAYFGPEAEFFIFDDVRFSSGENHSFYEVDSVEGRWNSGRDEGPNLGYKPRYKEGYFPVPPTDHFNDLRNEMVRELMNCGLDVETQHHEVASGGQSEIDLRFAPLVKASDELLLFKYIIKNVAFRNNRSVTFMPKPVFADNGSGMHVHMSLWKDAKPLFYGDRYAGLSEMALHFIGGLLKHAPALCAITNPTTNSYKRLVPGYEAPVNLAYSQRNRSASVRIPMYSSSPKSKRVEFRTPDPSTNPYLAFSALLMAGLDGVMNRIDPGDPLDKDIYDMKPEELRNVPNTPATLEQALMALERDHDFLLRGGVFTESVVETWIDYKLTREAKEIALRPHPYEFNLYYDV
ncbi:MAG: type I glutamate--ammonia ligase [Ignavibacteria bacterium]|nr:MAG: type I glutamate--ammonia ligase [Ignavibacteria bacterium]